MMRSQNQHFTPSTEEHFFVIGLNYLKADAETRGHFSLSEASQEVLLRNAKQIGFQSLSVISTCNRTELYGFAKNENDIIALLCKHTVGTVAEFEKVGYTYKNSDAVSHLFKVGTGLDSQILGDFEIISQLRKSFRFAKELGLLNAYMERLINVVIQSSKRIKNETGISSGATSVSFAAVQYIMARVPYVSEKNILLFGVGKIGRNTCENLIKHTRNNHITLINRTKVKAEEVAGKFNLLVKDYANIQSEIAQADILVVATGAQQPTINKELLYLKKPLLILDLSIPKNVSENVSENPLVTLVHLDELSKMTDQTLSQRKADLPKALKIIEEAKEEFNTWASHRKFAPTIKAIKEKLSEIKAGEIDFQKKKIEGFHEEHAEILADRLIQKIATQVVGHLKNANGTSQDSIEILKQVFELET
ncbi:glutamyl-tRNA reductase [Aureisphaera sp. CAU 1614]|uniref:Glutamyl-tRNA reductase n=1 Tax=Halomarinibacterium sedimenti TaxID=2857106 RepID=A0A9X1JY40_9FLAO|nr:glutamyl-tRNA reductase [Halomarinibacterium sedimenti]MBW2937172.1 glutamyl-tRNA reductase [Halomarinibacterium sedimenti]